MDTDITRLSGPNYFHIADPEAADCLAKAGSVAKYIEADDGLEAARRRTIGRRLSRVVGYRRAEQIAEMHPADISGFIAEEGARRERLSANQKRLFEGAYEGAEARLTCMGDTDALAEGLMWRDAIFNTLQRTGVGDISDMAGRGDSVYIVDEMARGYSLTDILGRDMMDLVYMVPGAMLSLRSRANFRAYLLSCGFGEKHTDAILSGVPSNNGLQVAADRLDGIIKIPAEELTEALREYARSRDRPRERMVRFSERVRLDPMQTEEAARILKTSLRDTGDLSACSDALRQLAGGDADIGWINPRYSNYRRQLLLGTLMTDLGLKETGDKHYHIPAFRYAHMVEHSYADGDNPMPGRLLAFLEELSGVRADISSWGKGGGHLLNPVRKVTPDVMGGLYGILVLGNGYCTKKAVDERGHLRYSVSGRPLSALLDSLERVGSYTEPPFSEDEKKSCYISDHFHSLVTGVPSELFGDPEFARPALREWITDKRIRGKDTYAASIHPDNVPIMQTMARSVGLEVTDGYMPAGPRRMLVSIRNPQILGY